MFVLWRNSNESKVKANKVFFFFYAFIIHPAHQVNKSSMYSLSTAAITVIFLTDLVFVWFKLKRVAQVFQANNSFTKPSDWSPRKTHCFTGTAQWSNCNSSLLQEHWEEQDQGKNVRKLTASPSTLPPTYPSMFALSVVLELIFLSPEQFVKVQVKQRMPPLPSFSPPCFLRNGQTFFSLSWFVKIGSGCRACNFSFFYSGHMMQKIPLITQANSIQISISM